MGDDSPRAAMELRVSIGDGLGPDPEALGRRRVRLHLINLVQDPQATAVAARVGSMLLGLGQIAILTRTLRPSDFGLLSSLVPIAALLALLDLGVSQALITKLNDPRSLDPADQRRTVEDSLRLSATLALLTAASVTAIAPFVWSSSLTEDHKVAGFSFLILTLLGAALNPCNGALVGLLEMRKFAICQILGNAICLGLLFAAASMQAPLFVIALAFASATPIANFLAFVTVRRMMHVGAPRSFSLTGVGQAFGTRLNMGLFVVQICSAASLQTDVLVIAGFSGLAAVAPYAVALKICNVLISLQLVALTPVWPRVGAQPNRLAAGMKEWRRLRAFVGLSAVGGIGFFLLGPYAFGVLAGGSTHVTRTLLLGFGVWIALYPMGIGPNMILYGLGRVRPVAMAWLTFSVLNVASTILSVQKYGPTSAIFCTAATFFLCLIIPFFIILRSILEFPARGVS